MLRFLQAAGGQSQRRMILTGKNGLSAVPSEMSVQPGTFDCGRPLGGVVDLTRPRVITTAAQTNAMFDRLRDAMDRIYAVAI